MEKPVVTAIPHDDSTAVVKLFPVPYGPEFLSKLFTTLAEKGVGIDIITQSQNEEGQRLAFSVSQEDLPLAKEVLKKFLTPEIKATIMENMAKVSAVGVGMRNHPGVAARFFTALSKNKIEIQLVTTSEILISAVIDRKNLEVAAQALHKEFIK